MSTEPDENTEYPLLEKSVRLLALVGGFVLLGIMCLIVYSVFMRRVFNAPPLGVYDTAEVMLIPVVAFALAYTGLTKGHIAVDVISVLASPKFVSRNDTIILFTCACLMGLLTWECINLVFHSIAVNEVTQMVEIPYYPFVIMLALGAAMFTLVLFVQTWNSFREVIGKSKNE